MSCGLPRRRLNDESTARKSEDSRQAKKEMQKIELQECYRGELNLSRSREAKSIFGSKEERRVRAGLLVLCLRRRVLTFDCLSLSLSCAQLLLELSRS